MPPLPTILSAGDADLGKVVIGILVLIVWGISAMVSNLKKASNKTGQKSWQEILNSLPGQPQSPPQQSQPNLIRPPTAGPATPLITNPRITTPRTNAPRTTSTFIQAAKVPLRRPPAKFAHQPLPPRTQIAPTSMQVARNLAQVSNPPTRPYAAPQPPAHMINSAAAHAHSEAGGRSETAGNRGARIEMAGGSTRIAGTQTDGQTSTGLSEALTLLRTPSSIRTQFILAEILQSPIALRDDKNAFE